MDPLQSRIPANGCKYPVGLQFSCVPLSQSEGSRCIPMPLLRTLLDLVSAFWPRRPRPLIATSSYALDDGGRDVRRSPTISTVSGAVLGEDRSSESSVTGSCLPPGWPSELWGPLVWSGTQANEYLLNVFKIGRVEREELEQALVQFKGSCPLPTVVSALGLH